MRTGAANPSISRDGRFVAFSTGERLVPADVNENVDVYVRDMAVPRGPAAYRLVSARDGSEQPARYGGEGGPGAPGADVTPGMAISGDGNRVVFRTIERTSDLPAAPAPDIAPYQVYVRDLAARSTRLLTVSRGDGSPAGGALSGAAISRDGGTVVWTGLNAAAQTRMLEGEFADPNAYTYLWRRVDGGETRRITGAADVDDPACSGPFTPNETAEGPCYGPLTQPESGVGGIAEAIPSLSADGTRVLFVTAVSPRPLTQGLTLDLFLTDMRAGVSRKAGTLELTREGTSRDPVASSPVERATLSADGRFAAIVTQRTRFLAPSPPLTSSVRTTAGFSELYLLDLAGTSIERVVRGRDGADADGNVVGTPSLSDDGTRVAFLSAATNLFHGDANGRTDAFVADRLAAAPPVAEPAEPPLEPVEALPPEPEPPRVPRLAVSVRRAGAQAVRLEVRAHAAGRLTVRVRGRVPDADGRPRGSAKLLGSLNRTVKKAGRVTVTVKLAKRYRGALRRAGSIAAQASVELVPKRGDRRSRTLTVRFRAKRS